MRKKELERENKLLSNRVSYLEGMVEDYKLAFHHECNINRQLCNKNTQIAEEFKLFTKDCEELRKLSAQLTSDNLYLNEVLKEKNDRIDILEAVIEAQKADLKKLQPKHSYIIRVVTEKEVHEILVSSAISYSEAKEKAIRDFDLSREKIIKIDGFKINQ